jgi:hypothetical protein
MTTVVNLRLDKYDVYCGRGSLFGNPYSHLPYGKHQFQVATRDEACDRFQEHFDKRIAEDKEFKKEVLKLKDKRLGCYCKQKNKFVRCHVDTIKDWLDNYEKDKS